MPPLCEENPSLFEKFLSWLRKLKSSAKSIRSLIADRFFSGNSDSNRKNSWLPIRNEHYEPKSSCSSVTKPKPTTAPLREDSLLEVLSWLPAKKLCELKAVSNSVYSLISDRYFSVQQSRHAEEDSAVILQGFDDFDLIFLDSSDIPEDSFDFLRRTCKRISASSNGLLFFQNKRRNNSRFGDLCVFNPVLQAFHPIYLPANIRRRHDDARKIGVAVVFDEDGVNYHMITITPTHSPTVEWASLFDCMRYSSRDSSWEYLGLMDAGKRNIDVEQSIVAHGGSLYWASDTANYISVDAYVLEFDTNIRAASMIALPDEVTRLKTKYYPIRVASWAADSLCLVRCKKFSPEFTLWVMKKERQTYSWIKTNEISLPPWGFGIKVVGSFTVINSKLLVFSMENEIYIYNMEEGKLNNLQVHASNWYPIIRSYASTFRTCGHCERFEIMKLAVDFT